MQYTGNPGFSGRAGSRAWYFKEKSKLWQACRGTEGRIFGDDLGFGKDGGNQPESGDPGGNPE